MTVICFKDGMLAADRQNSCNGMISAITKIRRHGKWIFGGCGSAPEVWSLFAWVEGGMKPAKFPAFQKPGDFPASLILVSSGGIYVLESTPHLVPVECEAWAIGSGREFAMGAMRAGKSATEAVLIASEFDTGCGQGVDFLPLAPTKKRR